MAAPASTITRLTEEEEDEKIATLFEHVIQALRNGSGADREQQYSISEYSTQEGQAAYLSASHHRLLL